MTKFNAYDAVTADVKASIKSASNRTLINDWFRANGVTPGMFKSPGKDGTAAHVQHFAAINVAIVDGFSAADKRVIRADAKALKEGNKAGQKGDAKNPAPGTRRYVQQQIGAKRNDYMRAFAKYLGEDGSKGADQKKTDDKTFCIERVVAMKKRLEKSEGAPFDIPEVIKVLGQLAKLIG